MKYKINILILGVIVMEGCLTMPRIDYSVKMTYSENVILKNVEYGDNPYIWGGGVLGVKVVPETSTIEWKNNNTGKTLTKTIPIKSKIPSDFDFTRDELIIHVNDDDSVNLTFSLELEKYHWVEIDNTRRIISRNPPNYLKDQNFYRIKAHSGTK